MGAGERSETCIAVRCRKTDLIEHLDLRKYA